MTEKIPKDHRGFVLFPTIFRDVQTHISEEEERVWRIKKNGKRT